jgi:hypothetical protein
VTRSTTSLDEVHQAFATGEMLDLAGTEVPATLLVELLTRAPVPAEGRIPALRLSGAVIRGPLKLPGATVTALVEFTGCTFDEPIDLYAAEMVGWRLDGCTLHGLQAANLRVRSELALENCTVVGPVMLADARIEGPLRLIGTRLTTVDDHALSGVRLTVSGVLTAQRLQTQGEVRLAGARVDGNLDLRGAQPCTDQLDGCGDGCRSEPSATATGRGGQPGGSRCAGCSGRCGLVITSCPTRQRPKPLMATGDLCC